MKKYDEYEKQSELKADQVPAAKAAGKQPHKKNVLLQTYFTSLLGLILCVSMFFGTSYAWFTSEVNNTANEIYVGTLKVGLYKGEACTPENSLATNSKKLFDSNIRWEPGYTALEVITVKNEGDLAFKYALSFTDGTLAAGSGASLDAVAKHFEVWVFNHRNPNHTYVKPASYAGISEANGWKYIGNLVNILNGEVVLEGNMVTVRQAGQNADAINPGTTDGVGTLDTYTIALHMNEDAKSDVMGHKIMLNVKLVAYQKASEADALDNKDYDQLVVTENDLREALKNGGQVTLLEDIVLSETVSIPADKTVVLDLNGHNISQTKACTESYEMINNKGTLTITGNGKISFTDAGTGDPNFGWGSYTIRNEGTLVVENSTIEHLGTQTAGTHCIQAIYQYAGSTTINDGIISTPNYRSIRLWHGDVIINGGVMDGQVWVQTQTGDPASLTINGGSFSPNGDDMSSVYVENEKNTVAFSVTGGEFETKIGASKPDDLAGSITGGEFSEVAKKDTADILFAETFEG